MLERSTGVPSLCGGNAPAPFGSKTIYERYIRLIVSLLLESFVTFSSKYLLNLYQKIEFFLKSQDSIKFESKSRYSFILINHISYDSLA